MCYLYLEDCQQNKSLWLIKVKDLTKNKSNFKFIVIITVCMYSNKFLHRVTGTCFCDKVYTVLKKKTHIITNSQFLGHPPSANCNQFCF